MGALKSFSRILRETEMECGGKMTLKSIVSLASTKFRNQNKQIKTTQKTNTMAKKKTAEYGTKIAEIIELHKKGFSYAEIEKKGYNMTTIRIQCAKFNREHGKGKKKVAKKAVKKTAKKKAVKKAPLKKAA